MKVRIQGKRRFAFRSRYIVWAAGINHLFGKLSDSFTAVPDMSPEAVAKREADFNAFWDDLVAKQSVRQLVEPADVEVETAKIEYVVAKVSTGEVVDTFDLREDALALIKKHVRQKKAKLTLVPMDGVEPFTEEELAA